jgi:hypothetical protein
MDGEADNVAHVSQFRAGVVATQWGLLVYRGGGGGGGGAGATAMDADLARRHELLTEFVTGILALDLQRLNLRLKPEDLSDRALALRIAFIEIARWLFVCNLYSSKLSITESATADVPPSRKSLLFGGATSPMPAPFLAEATRRKCMPNANEDDEAAGDDDTGAAGAIFSSSSVPVSRRAFLLAANKASSMSALVHYVAESIPFETVASIRAKTFHILADIDKRKSEAAARTSDRVEREKAAADSKKKRKRESTGSTASGSISIGGSYGSGSGPPDYVVTAGGLLRDKIITFEQYMELIAFGEASATAAAASAAGLSHESS